MESWHGLISESIFQSNKFQNMWLIRQSIRLDNLPLVAKMASENGRFREVCSVALHSADISITTWLCSLTHSFIMASHEVTKHELKSLVEAFDILWRQIDHIKSRNKEIQDYLLNLDANVSLL